MACPCTSCPLKTLKLKKIFNVAIHNAPMALVVIKLYSAILEIVQQDGGYRLNPYRDSLKENKTSYSSYTVYNINCYTLTTIQPTFFYLIKAPL